MKTRAKLALLLANGVVSAMLASCGLTDDGRCVPPPCPLPLAVIINVTVDAGGGSVSGALVRVSGPIFSTIPCNTGTGTTCQVPGLPGTYNLVVEAPGFLSAQRTVVVQGTTPECACPTITIEHLDVALAAA